MFYSGLQGMHLDAEREKYSRGDKKEIPLPLLLTHKNGRSRMPVLLLTAGIITAILLPPVLWMLKIPFIGNTYGKTYLPFELFGFSMSCLLMTEAGAYFYTYRHKKPTALIPAGLFFLVCFFYLTFVSEFSMKSYDYECYESAALALTQGRSPYLGCYLYPPLPAQIMAFAYRAGVEFSRFVGINDNQSIWNGLFYFYQCAQLLLVASLFLLGYKFARTLGIASVPASVLMAVLLLINNPLIRTLRNNQINLWMVDLLLAAFVLLDLRPASSGLCVAVAAHIKIYPGVLILPFLLCRRWKAAFWGLAGAGALVALEAGLYGDWSIWHDFISRAASFPAIEIFRNNSLTGIVYNSFRILKVTLGVDVQVLRPFFVTALSLAIITWTAMRFSRRRRCDVAYMHPMPELYLISGDSMDAIALTLLLSPLVWEHHYVLAVPLVIWAIATVPPAKRWQIGLSALLMLALPTFDFFPFSYHRIAGLIILLIATSPDRGEQGRRGIQPKEKAEDFEKTVPQ